MTTVACVLISMTPRYTRCYGRSSRVTGMAWIRRKWWEYRIRRDREFWARVTASLDEPVEPLDLDKL